MGIFSPSGAGQTGGSGSSIEVTNPLITNVSVPLAATEVAIALPANTKRFLIRARKVSNAYPQIQLAYISGDSGTIYLTVPGGAYYSEGEIDAPSLTLYIQSNTPATIIEIVSWT